MPLDSTTLVRLWSYIQKSPRPDACWPWLAAVDRRGYGRFKAGGKTHYVSRLICELTYGPFPPGYETRHTCDNPRCCRPAHLVPGTHTENMRDCAERGRSRLPAPRYGEANVMYRRPELIMRGEANSSAKLTDEKVREMRRLYAAGGVTYYDLAARFGLAYQHVWRVVHRHAWKHIA